ncbi:MAG: trypsin-like peptidase domain-containing protein [Thermoleophilia bacterium]|nr:trypsin-like peptidase domain-containing protein [Thermoleophilia bacterium]
MKRNLLYIANAFVAGLAGAALFFMAAFYLHWGGIGQERVTVSEARPAAVTPPVSQPVSAAGDSMTPAQIYEKYADSSVQIVTTFEGGRSFFRSDSGGRAIGSGFVVSADGYILTNAHVIVDWQRRTPQQASKVEVNFRNGKSAEASIVGYDLTSSDVAVLKVDAAGIDLVPVVMGDSESVIVGEPVVAIGSPFGLYSSSITSGIVSATDRTVESPEAGFAIQNAIQTDASINSGNSGGPLFNMRGEVIGLNEQIATVSGGSEGVGFAVPINTAKLVMDQIVATGKVEYAWMGIVGQSVTAEAADDLDLSVDRGALVVEAQSDGPAAQAGLQKNDVIVKIDDQDIETMEEVTGVLIARKPDDTVKVTFIRGGETRETELKLGKRPERL